MKTRRPWQPHMTEPRILNPFAPVTEASQPRERIELEDEEGGAGESAEEAPPVLAEVEKGSPAD